MFTPVSTYPSPLIAHHSPQLAESNGIIDGEVAAMDETVDVNYRSIYLQARAVGS